MPAGNQSESRSAVESGITIGERKDANISFISLLKRPPIAVLCLVRIADPLGATSILSYLFYQLRFLSPAASDAEIATHVGLLVGAKTAAKVCTGLFWGRLADSSSGGRKRVLLIGLVSSCIASIGYGLSTTFGMAMAWQVFSGAMSSNVGIARTITAELYPDKNSMARSRALLLLPLAANVGMLLGPLLGGFLSSTNATAWLELYPYALPNLVIAACYALATLGTLFYVEETLDSFDGSSSKRTFARLWQRLCAIRPMQAIGHAYAPLPLEEPIPLSASDSPSSPQEAEQNKGSRPKLRFRDIWTSQVVCTLISHFIIAGHIGAFSALWAVFLSSPVQPRSSSRSSKPTDRLSPRSLSRRSILSFTGGVGLDPSSVGVIMSLLGAIGVVLQLVLFPRLKDRFGTVRVWRAALYFFPLAYMLAPFPALFASSFLSPSSPNNEGGQSTTTTTSTSTSNSSSTPPVAVWLSITAVVFLFMTGRTGSQAGMTLLINDCVPAPDARGTINVAGTVVGNLSRSLFPVATMALYGWGLEKGAVGTAFWALSVFAVIAIVSSWWVRVDR